MYYPYVGIIVHSLGSVCFAKLLDIQESTWKGLKDLKNSPQLSLGNI